MCKLSGKYVILLGTALIMSALFLAAHNRSEDRLAGREATRMTEKGQEKIKNSENSISQPDTVLDPEMPKVKIDGYDYVGYISVPAIQIELPVMAEWDYSRLKKAPCRQFGSSRTDDLVIAAHNYRSHFGRLKELETGDEVVFTDMEGIVNTYTVEKTQVLEPASVELVENSGYDLVLYTCTYGGKSRVCVLCDRE